MARLTDGFNKKGHPQYKIIGYFETKEQGLSALAEYHNNPYDVNKANFTLEELFILFVDKKFKRLGISVKN